MLPYVGRMTTIRPLLTLFLCAIAAGAALPAVAATGDWATGAKAKVRLISAGVGADGSIDGALEIVLPPGWKTYWRNPGTAGIPPLFDFSASRNIGDIAVSFPVPQKVDDGYSVTNVYEGGVVLPISATVADPKSAAELTVEIKLGVCEEVCIPDDVTAHLALPAGAGEDRAAAAIVAEARAKVPGKPEPGVFAVDSVAREGGTDAKPVFRIAATVPATGETRLFVEGPDDWSPYEPVLVSRDGDRVVYDAKFSRTGAKTPIGGASIRVTIASGDRAIEQTSTLD